MVSLEGDKTYGVYMILIGVVLLLYLIFVHGNPLSLEPMGSRRLRRPIVGTLVSTGSIILGCLTVLGYYDQIKEHFK